MPKIRGYRRSQNQRIINRRMDIAKNVWRIKIPSEKEENNYFVPGKFAKRSNGCGCSKKKKGSPKVWKGMCKCRPFESRKRSLLSSIRYDFDAED